MTSEKYKQVIYEKYLPKVQRIIDVFNSCETAEQRDACREWFKKLMSQWRDYENAVIIEKGGFFSAAKAMGMTTALCNLVDCFIFAYENKTK